VIVTSADVLSWKLSVSLIDRLQRWSMWFLWVALTQRALTRRPVSANLRGETTKVDSTGGDAAPGLVNAAAMT
jgi:hypothetical protein